MENLSFLGGKLGSIKGETDCYKFEKLFFDRPDFDLYL